MNSSGMNSSGMNSCMIMSPSGVLIGVDMSLALLCEVPFDVSFFV
jgi:hypothetical protein